MELLDLLLALTKVLGAVVAATTLYLWANLIAVHRSLRRVILRWEKPDFGAISLVIFLVMMLFLCGSLLSYAFYVRDVGRVVGAEKWLYMFIGLSGLLLLSGLIYLSLKMLYIQPISEEGVYRIFFCKRRLLFRAELLPWSELYDYYVRQGEFFSTFTFISRSGKAYRIIVPTYLVKTLANIADYGMDKYAFLMRYSRKASKSSRHT